MAEVSQLEAEVDDARGTLSHVPWTHWAVMGVVSLALTVILLIRKKCSVYGAIALGLTVFMGLFLLDTAVGIRYLGIMKHAAGHDLTLDFSRMFRKSGQGPVETLSNIAVFVPFGFFLGEWLASSNRTGSWRRVRLVALAAFGLSLCIECLQLVLHADYEWWRGQMDRDAGQTCCLFAFCLSLRIEVLQLILLLGQGYGFCVGYGRGVGGAWMSARVRKVAEGDENRTIGRY